MSGTSRVLRSVYEEIVKIMSVASGSRISKIISKRIEFNILMFSNGTLVLLEEQ